MRTWTFLTGIFFICITNILPAQEKTGFEALLSAKAQVENITKKFSTLPTTSLTYRKYYNDLNNAFIKAADEYESYKGSMIDCINISKSENSSKKCLSENSINLKDHLNKLISITDKAYNEHFQIPQTTGDKNTPLKPAGIFDIVPLIINNLVDGGMRLWKNMKDLKGQKKKDYIDQINSASYKLKSFDEIVPPPR